MKTYQDLDLDNDNMRNRTITARRKCMLPKIERKYSAKSKRLLSKKTAHYCTDIRRDHPNPNPNPNPRRTHGVER